MRGQLREVEVQADSQMQSRLSVMDEKKGDFDPLEFDRYTRLQELTRLMAESLNDVLAIQQGLHKNIGDTDAALLHQARISREVQQELMRVRAVPFSNLNERLYRIVRQVARELDKKAELEIAGAEVELDRSVLERIGAPLEHMLRNALVHGIEAPGGARRPPAKRRAGASPSRCARKATKSCWSCRDDGAGLDLEALRRKGARDGPVASRPRADRGRARPAGLRLRALDRRAGDRARRPRRRHGRGAQRDHARSAAASTSSPRAARAPRSPSTCRSRWR